MSVSAIRVTAHEVTMLSIKRADMRDIGALGVSMVAMRIDRGEGAGLGQDSSGDGMRNAYLVPQHQEWYIDQSIVSENRSLSVASTIYTTASTCSNAAFSHQQCQVLSTSLIDHCNNYSSYQILVSEERLISKQSRPMT
ncbi:hypothetical protein Cni_G01138 [Canna indica]|uniref:Uncharacterized protein n=1 Tax=Canna indica TaxID=4628 RepID=A0AAQ3JNU2_9LILI|nr:hypothetical protein Cni_G01138 [Canna indica]